jgi:hypothetical protein
MANGIEPTVLLYFICQIKNGPSSSRAIAEASFDFQMASRQIR